MHVRKSKFHISTYIEMMDIYYVTKEMKKEMAMKKQMPGNVIP